MARNRKLDIVLLAATCLLCLTVSGSFVMKGGAEAVSIQGQRIISTSGIKCVGNSVVLHGIPYAPPYVIEAIGDAGRMAAALKESRALTIYRQYADAYGLGYRESVESSVSLPAFQGALGITHARSR